MQTIEHDLEMFELPEEVAGRHEGIIVEFVGPTGCGKTTNCKHFLNLLRSKDINAISFSDVKKYLYGLPRSRRLRLYTKAIQVNRAKLIAYARLLIGAGIFSINSLYRYAKLLVFDGALREVIQVGEVDIVLLDQWSIQGLWSATIFKKKKPNDLGRKLRSFFLPVDIILYFDADVSIAAERIALRNPTRSRFDKMTAIHRIHELEKYNAYLARLFQDSECTNKFVLSATNSPGENAVQFLTILSDYLKQKKEEPWLS